MASWLVCSTPIERSGFEPWPGSYCCHFVVILLGKTLYSHGASLHPMHKWVPSDLMLEVTLRWTSIPAGSRNTPSRSDKASHYGCRNYRFYLHYYRFYLSALICVFENAQHLKMISSPYCEVSATLMFQSIISSHSMECEERRRFY